MNHELPKLDAIRKMFNLSKDDADVLAANVHLDSVVVYRNYIELDRLMLSAMPKNVKVRDPRLIETVCLMQCQDGNAWCRGIAHKSVSDIHNRELSRKKAFYRAFGAMLSRKSGSYSEYDVDLNEREWHIVGED